MTVDTALSIALLPSLLLRAIANIGQLSFREQILFFPLIPSRLSESTRASADPSW